MVENYTLLKPEADVEADERVLPQLGTLTLTQEETA